MPEFVRVQGEWWHEDGNGARFIARHGVRQGHSPHMSLGGVVLRFQYDLLFVVYRITLDFLALRVMPRHVYDAVLPVVRNDDETAHGNSTALLCG
jgi:hypothetical protein